MKTSILLFTLSISCLYIGCKSNNHSSSNTKQIDTVNYINLTVLLDLSDRNLAGASCTTNYVQQDTQIIRNVLNEFSEKVKLNGYIYSKDKIQVLAAPQNGNEPLNNPPFIEIEQL